MLQSFSHRAEGTIGPGRDFFFFLGKIYGRQKVSLKQVLKGDLHSSKFVKHQHGNFYVI